MLVWRIFIKITVLSDQVVSFTIVDIEMNLVQNIILAGKINKLYMEFSLCALRVYIIVRKRDIVTLGDLGSKCRKSGDLFT